MNIRARIEDAKRRYTEANGHPPERLILTQDQYMQLNAEVGEVIHEFAGLPIVIKWGATTNKAISP